MKTAVAYAIVMVLCATASATITLADLNLQAQRTIAALNASTLATDEFTALTGQIHGAFNRWQSTWAQIDVENKRQAYLREYARFNAMLDAYGLQ